MLVPKQILTIALSFLAKQMRMKSVDGNLDVNCYGQFDRLLLTLRH